MICPVTDHHARAAVDWRQGVETWQDEIWGEGIPVLFLLQGNHETETSKKTVGVVTLKVPVK